MGRRRYYGPEDFDRIRRGDMIRYGAYVRTVRRVKRDDCGLVQGVWLAILRQSWTNSPYTILTRSDLRHKWGGIVARRKDAETLCSTDKECRVQKAIDEWADLGAKGGAPPITATESVGEVW